MIKRIIFLIAALLFVTACSTIEVKFNAFNPLFPQINSIPSFSFMSPTPFIDEGSQCQNSANSECTDSRSQNFFCNVTSATNRVCNAIKVVNFKDLCGSNAICDKGLFCRSVGFNTYCTRLAGPGYTISNPATDSSYYFCVNSVKQFDRCAAYNESTVARKENEECNKNDDKDCEAGLECIKGYCRKPVEQGERCNSNKWPYCRNGLVCNLGYCVAEQSLPHTAPADNNLACSSYAIDAKDKYCAERCSNGVKCGNTKICNNGTCIDLFSLPDGSRADHPDACESGKRSVVWCVPETREKCYSNYDCSKSGAICRGASVKDHIPGACTDSKFFYTKQYTIKYNRCLSSGKNTKDCDIENKDLDVKKLCSDYCYRRTDYRFVGGNVIYDCAGATTNDATAANLIDSQFVNCDAVRNTYSAVGKILPSFVVMSVTILSTLLLIAF